MSRKKVWASTYQLTDGRWQAAKNVPMPDGRRRRITGTGASSGEALARCEANWGRYLAETHGDPSKRQIKPQKAAEGRVTFDEWFRQWHAGLNPQKVSETVRRKYLRLGEMHLLPTLGRDALGDITHQQLNELIHRQLTRSGALSDAARSNVYKVLNLSLERARKESRIVSNPLALVDRPVFTQKDEAVPQKAHLVRSLIGHMDKDENRARLLVMLLGLRTGEKLGLTWDQVKFSSSTGPKLHVQQQLARHEDGRGYYIKPNTKTKAGMRIIPLTEPWLSALRAEKRRQNVWRKSAEWNPKPGLENLVFTTKTGAPVTANRDNAEWHAFLGAHDYTYWRRHLNRHVTATLLKSQGIPLSVAKDILGHNSEAMSAYYTSTMNETLVEPLRAYGAHLSEQIRKADQKRQAKEAN